VVSLKTGLAVHAEPTPSFSRDRAERFGRIFSKNYRFAWRLLRRLGVAPGSVEDATQQVFLVVAERLDDIAPESERGFVYGTVLRVAWTSRRGAAHEVLSDSFDARTCPLPSPSELADQRRAREVLDLILARMPNQLRVVFVLYEIEGFTTPEIADVMQIPLGTAASRLRRGRLAFRQLVDELMTKAGDQ
jgi:RNA polymerase sigma-70 factor (ECF subfamily)